MTKKSDEKNTIVPEDKLTENDEERILNSKISRRISDNRRLISKAVNLHYKKIKAIEFLIGRNNVKCINPNCEMKADIILLPALEFHHITETLFSWRDISGYTLENILNLLSGENVIVLCLNCHIRESANTLIDYKELILDKNLFSKSPMEINNLISKSIIKSLDKAKIKYEINKWIKKRSIIEQLFDGKCIGCGKITVRNNLSSLSFHHRQPEIKESIWSDNLRYLEIEEIAKIIIQEDMVSLCSNCHRMIESYQFERNSQIILNRANYNNREDYDKKIHKYYQKLRQNIRNFRFKDKEIIDHLRLIFQWHRGDIWKLYLIHAYKIVKLKGKNLFTKKDMAYSLDVDEIQRGMEKPFQKLILYEFVKVIDENAFKHEFILTEKGKREAERVLGNLKELSLKDYKDLLNQVRVKPLINFRKEHKGLRDFLSQRLHFGEGWKEDLIHLYNIVEKKGSNEIKSNELRDSLNVVKKYSFLSERNPLQKLIKDGYVLKIKSHTSLPNLYILTDKGKKEAKLVINELQSHINFLKRSKVFRETINEVFSRDEYLNKYLMHMYFITEIKDQNLFDLRELAESLGYKQIASNVISHFVEDELIKFEKYAGRAKIYSLVSKGIRTAKKFWKKIFSGLKPDEINL